MAGIIKSIDEFNDYFNQGTKHQHIAVGDLSRADLTLFDPLNFNMYCVVLMDNQFGELIRSGEVINYKPGTLFTLRPGQVMQVNLNYNVKPRGWILAFREELTEKTGLGRDFYMFDYFNHDVNDALELSKSERGIILNCFSNIYSELITKPDYLTGHLLRLGIGQLLSYYKRFFERQFADRVRCDNQFQKRLETIIDNYLSSGSAQQLGQLKVSWCAKQFNLSPNYFGDLVKKELHMSAQDYIHNKVVETAKYLLDTTEMPVNEIAQELGFNYPNHFNRMFRLKTGTTPLQYRKRISK